MGGGMLLGLGMFVQKIIKLWFWVMFAAIMLCGGIIGTVVSLAIYSAFSMHMQDTWPMIFIFIGTGVLAWTTKLILLKHFAYSGRVLWFI